MITETLQLKYRSTPQREVAAWFIAGPEPAAWLAEICRWAVPQDQLRLFIAVNAGAGPADRAESAGGVLVIFPAGSPLPAEARGLALGVIGEKLYLPVNAEIYPAVTVAEVRLLCGAAITLFHPGIGVLNFDPAGALGLADLLLPTAVTSADWNGARAGAVLSSRLRGVALLALPQADNIFAQEQQEIGADPVVDLPPRPGEPSDGAAGRIGRKLAGWSAGLIGKFFASLPANSARRTWVDGIMDWASAKLAQVSRQTEELRHRELHRLMELLENDPERGLRHALPLGDALGRGRVAPQSRLGSHDINFDSSRLGGGRPADPWAVPWELRQKLTARYRQLALREQQLGRFKRAAYIHAELLGDLNAAAAVLKEGGLFADAAVVYRDLLGKTRAAAECLAEGGLYLEAIALYQKEGAFMEVGDLSRRIGDEAGAAIAYRRVVEEKLAALDFLSAALVLELKLLVPDEALALLAKGWPHSPQATQCLRAEFALLGRLGRHEAAGQRLAALQQENTPAPQVIALARVLAELKNYPDHTLRPRAADLARVKLCTPLTSGDAAEARAATMLLTELAPDDRLLPRDSSRFLVTRLESLTKAAQSPRPRKTGSDARTRPELQRKFQLPNVAVVYCAVRCGSHFFAVTRQDATILLIRGDWEGIVQAASWSGDARQISSIVSVFDPASGYPDRVFLNASGPLRNGFHALARTHRFDRDLLIAVPPWLPDGILAAAMAEGLLWTVRGTATGLILEARGKSGNLTGTFDLEYPSEELGEALEYVSMLALRSQVWIAIQSHLLVFEGGKVQVQSRCESPILGLESDASSASAMVVARCQSGAVLFWARSLAAQTEMLAPTLEAPLAAFMRNGRLVLLATEAGPDGFEGQIIDFKTPAGVSVTDFCWRGASPVALVATRSPDTVAVFSRSGEVQVIELPGVG